MVEREEFGFLLGTIGTLEAHRNRDTGRTQQLGLMRRLAHPSRALHADLHGRKVSSRTSRSNSHTRRRH